MSRVPHILKAFYDNDLLEEEVILEWDEKVAGLECLSGVSVHHGLPMLQVTKKHVSKEKAKEIREKAAPFVTWLRTAEEESSEDDGEGFLL